jgi:periplasmic copper chaperone A
MTKVAEKGPVSMSSVLKAILTAAVLSTLSAVGAYGGDIAVNDAFARASTGAAKVGAAFMTLRNSGAMADALVGVKSPVAARAELHTHIEDGGIMRMRQVDAIDVPARGSVSLQPGGLHIMLIDLKQPLKQGEAFPLTLTFAKAGTMTIEVPVKSQAETAPMPSHQH